MQIQIIWLLHLHCLLRQGMSCLAKEGLTSLCNVYTPVFPYTIVIKHGFSCINICQVPREVLKTEAMVFNTSQRTWRMLMHWKTMFDSYYCIKSENICYISRYILHFFVSHFHWCLEKVISMDCARFKGWALHASRRQQFCSASTGILKDV